MKIGRFVLMTIMAIVTLTVTCSAATGGPNGYAGENYKINAITGVDFRPYNTVTVGEFSDMLARAMFGDSADVSVDEDYADKPATISFIAEAYQSATGNIGVRKFIKGESKNEKIQKHYISCSCCHNCFRLHGECLCNAS